MAGKAGSVHGQVPAKYRKLADPLKPDNARPHHLIFIADPQLIDPHTYPGRPWPLSALTYFFTDLYIYRSFAGIRKSLRPDTVFFLGDLFDGGREWSTATSKSPDEQWRSYGQKFWLKEYNRFDKIFFKQWTDEKVASRYGQPGRKIIASLPGNHDLGFGSGVQRPVRNRFNAYFGDGNRVDVIANHTIISLDSVSLSALGAEREKYEDIWRPPMEFLDDIQNITRKVVRRELMAQAGLSSLTPMRHEVLDVPNPSQPPAGSDAGGDTVDLPTVLLSHVPLYRAPDTPCGPLRERWPPSPPPKGQTEPLESDRANAIAVSRGYQYQNVLTLEISKMITERIRGLRYAFSGDDHDYCEVLHRAFPSSGSGIREITVKSISWAMGVRKPGFLLVSLWNPVDSTGTPISAGKGQVHDDATLQTRLCLLPDQLSIFMRYGTLFLVTLITLSLRAAKLAIFPARNLPSAPTSPVLPTTESRVGEKDLLQRGTRARASSASYAGLMNSSNLIDRGQLSSRSNNTRTRNLPTEEIEVHVPLIERAGYSGTLRYEEPDEWGMFRPSSRLKAKQPKGFSLFLSELLWSFGQVGAVVAPWYIWLIWTV